MYPWALPSRCCSSAQRAWPESEDSPSRVQRRDALQSNRPVLFRAASATKGRWAVIGARVRLGAVHATGAWGLGSESERRCAKSHSWDSWEFGCAPCDSSTVSGSNVLNLIIVLWLHERNVFVLRSSVLKYSRVTHHVSAT